MAEYIRKLNEPLLKGANTALLRAVVNATGIAKKNAAKNFKGTRIRPKSGALLASIFSGFEFKIDQAAEGFVGVRSHKGNKGKRPYGRIHEYGGNIKPVKAKNLWLPLFGPKSSGIHGLHRDLTPTEFIKRMKESRGGSRSQFFVKHKKVKGDKGKTKQQIVKKKGNYAIFKSKAGHKLAWFIERTGRGKSAKQKAYALFLLKQRTTIPARPYVTPAVEEAWKRLPDEIKAQLERGPAI